jgi:hypothetical protein
MPTETNSSLTAPNRPKPLTVCSVAFVPKELAIDRTSRLRELSTGVGLLVLAVGFSSLGFLALLKRPPDNATVGILSERTYSLIGSLLSLLVGMTFLAVVIFFVGTKLRGEPVSTPETLRVAAPGRSKSRQTANPVTIDL